MVPTVMDLQGDNTMEIKLTIYVPEWLLELSIEELHNVIEVAGNKAATAFENELNKSGKYWKLRKAAASEGQTDIYDYV